MDMTRLLHGLALGATMLVNTQAMAYDMEGPGSQTCAQFSQQYALQSEVIETNYFTWAEGFMTALNLTLTESDRKDFAAQDLASQKTYLRNYCSDHPQAFYADAVGYLWVSLPKIGK
jgi:hypothetical protein